MAGWLRGHVIGNRRWTETLFSLQVEAPPLAFEAGQFVRLALDEAQPGAEPVARPFSFVNAPGEALQEFYGVVVPGGALSPRLAALRPGDAIFLSELPSGFLVLSEVPDAPVLWLLATGTGIAPYVSMLRAGALWTRYQTVVVVHGVRHVQDLAYRDEIGRTANAQGDRLRYVAVVSRDPAGVGPTGGFGVLLAGRIPAAIANGQIEAAAGAKLSPSESQVLICGNPDMVQDTADILKARGMRKHRRRAPGQITTENFW